MLAEARKANLSGRFGGAETFLMSWWPSSALHRLPHEAQPAASKRTCIETSLPDLEQALSEFPVLAG
jgi:hypothetical protein